MMSNLDSLKEDLQHNLISYLDGMDNKIIDDMCDIVIETIDNFQVG